MVFVECPALTAFEARLTAVVGASAITDLYSDVGHRLGAAQLISTTFPVWDSLDHPPPPQSAGPGAAQGRTGFIKAKCHGVGAAVRWAHADFCFYCGAITCGNGNAVMILGDDCGASA